MISQKIDYEALTRKALLSVAKEILQLVALNGLYKKQHLYITFSLHHPGIEVSNTLREDFEDELTIVLEHEFWDLSIDDYGFSVSLNFDHGNESLYIPFSSIITVQDPSEDFFLEFSPDLKDIKPQPSKLEVKSNVISIDAFRKGK